jgi:aminoglycoside phosphotransferase (APT) family kinase protein
LTDMRKVEEGLRAMFNELCGPEARLDGFEDITVGWETQIVAFTLTQPGAEVLDLVARIYSGQSGGRKAEHEFNVMHRLAAVGYPVPTVYSYEAGDDTLGSPFIIMERIRGGILWDVFFSSPKEKYGEVLALNSQLMARLHEIPPRKVLTGAKTKTRCRVLNRVDAEAEGLRIHGLEPAFIPLIGWLRDNAGELIASPTCLIHQDLHPRNILLRPDGSPVVIDWAACAIGDFREDLCWTALLADTFIDESLKMAIYDSYAEASPRSLSDLPYFEALAGLRRLADAAVSMKAGAADRGMKPEAIREMDGNRPHYAKILKVVTETTGEGLPELTHFLG